MNEEVGAGSRGGFLPRLIWTFQSPRQLYEDIASGEAHWWQPWVWVSLINMVIAYMSIPIQVQLTSLNPRDVPEEQLQQTLEAMEKFGFLGVISTPVVVLITSLIIVGISYLVLSVLAEDARFKKYFTVYLYASIVSSVGLLLGTILTVSKGVENIRSIEDASSSFSPAILLPPGNEILRVVLSTGLDVFQVWFYLLVGAGVIHVFGLSKRSAVLVVVPVWLLFVLVSLVSLRLSR
jgi:energy-converting hydrogenase Eha subunit F